MSSTQSTRTSYPSDVSDDEWAFVAPYLVLLPRRWVVERAFAWSTRFRRLVRDYERLPAVQAGLHFVVFACLMLGQLLHVISSL